MVVARVCTVTTALREGEGHSPAVGGRCAAARGRFSHSSERFANKIPRFPPTNFRGMHGGSFIHRM